MTYESEKQPETIHLGLKLYLVIPMVTVFYDVVDVR